MAYNEGEVRRADLKLRTQFLGLKTDIYEIEEYQHIIQIQNYKDNFQELKEYFEKNICPLGCMITIETEKPKYYLKHISSLAFDNIVQKHEGIFLNKQMFNSLLISKFPEVNIINTRVEHIQGVIAIIEVDEKTDDSNIYPIKDFIMNMKCGYTDAKVVKIKVEGKSSIYIPDVGLACTDKNYLFSKRDSELWFGKAEEIYKGDFIRDDLYFFDKNKSKCYLDFSVWDNININLRSNMLLYDTTYVSLPLGFHIFDFLQKQNISKNDLVEMVEQNKLVVILPNTESRYDREIIDELYNHNSNSVISKRGINALIAMYFCELEKKFLSLFGDSTDLLFQIYKDLKLSKDSNSNILAEWLVWPVKAKLESYELFNSYGPMKLPTLGANRLFDFINEQNENSKNIKFEFTVNSSNIHIATALQATYFPFCIRNKDASVYSDKGVAKILGDVLNLYNYCNKSEQQQINSYTRIMRSNESAIRLLQTDNTVKMNKFLNKSIQYNTPDMLKRILVNLENMNETERRNRISDYNNVIVELGEEKENVPGKTMNYILSGAGFLPGIGTAASIVSLVKDLLGEINKIQEINRKDKIKKAIKTETERKDDKDFLDEVYLLDRLSRIAKVQ